MEYRRKTLCSALDDLSDNTEKQSSIRYVTPVSIDDTIDEYTEYVYNGIFNFTKMIYSGIIKLICPCCYRNREPR